MNSIINFCKRGHDLSVEGRYVSGACKVCAKEKANLRYKAHPKDEKQFCARGHNTFVIGRHKQSSACNVCIKINTRNCNMKRFGVKNNDGKPFSELDYDRAYQIQCGRCLICGKHQSELKRPLHSDHDHKTRLFRGLLCDSHNKGLGFFSDSIEELQSAIDYLKRFRNV